MAVVGHKYASMREGGKHLGQIRRELLDQLQGGLDLFSIEELAQNRIKQIGAKASFADVDSYGYATCLMVNDQVVHGRPRHYILGSGDLVTIDIGIEWQGWQLDTTDSGLVDQPDDSFVSTGRQALKHAIAMAKVGNYIGHISQAMQTIVEGAGYSVVQAYCGHGIGRQLHENPQILCYIDRPIQQTPVITEGMTLAIEVMMNEGSFQVKPSISGWDVRTADGSRSAQFEHTVLVTAAGPEILTK